METIATLKTQLEAVKAEQQAKKAAARAAKETEKLATWEAEVEAVNPAYVHGSVRRASADEAAQLSYCHGVVCDILCQECGTVRLVNKEDAKQVKYCVQCKRQIDREKAKIKRLEKRLAKVATETTAEVAAA